MDEFTITSKLSGRNVKNGTAPSKEQKDTTQENFKKVLDRVTLKTAVPETGSNKSKRSFEVRHDLVNKYRLDLKNGDYKVKSMDIADKMVQKIRDERSKIKL